MGRRGQVQVSAVGAGARRGPRAGRTGRGSGAAIARAPKPSARSAATPSTPASITATTDAASGKEQAGTSTPIRAAARSSTARIAAPVGDQRGRRAKRAAAPLRLGQRLDRVALVRQARFRSRPIPAWRAGADRGGQPHKVKPLALERIRRRAQPVAHRPGRAMVKRKLDQARVTAVKRAEKMDRIGKVARRFGPGRGGEGEAVGMNRRPFAGNPRNLRTGNVQQCAGRLPD